MDTSSPQQDYINDVDSVTVSSEKGILLVELNGRSQWGNRRFENQPRN